MTLREKVEQVLPGWKRWYPSLFDAATDLGLLRARVCSPQSLLLSNRHARERRAAQEAHRENWGGSVDGTSRRGSPGLLPTGRRRIRGR
jgi:hypothetical protein